MTAVFCPCAVRSALLRPFRAEEPGTPEYECKTRTAFLGLVVESKIEVTACRMCAASSSVVGVGRTLPSLAEGSEIACAS